MKTPIVKPLNKPHLLYEASQLSTLGKLALSQNNLLYLNIDDAYIHQLFPLLTEPGAVKPDYFTHEAIGAHISVIYPGELNTQLVREIGQHFNFSLKHLVSATLGSKIYYALLVESPDLIALRNNYHLSQVLCLKGYCINLHITVGIKRLDALHSG